MLVVYVTLWYEMIKATARAGTFVRTLRAQDRFCACLSRAWRWSEVEARDARLKRLRIDVVVKTFCDWINALHVKKKETETAVMSGMANPRLRPCVNGVK